MRAFFLSVEVVILLVPLTLVLCYTSVLTLIIGIPGSISQLFDSDVIFDSFLPLSAIGNIAGVYALIILWSLAISTIRHKPYAFTRNFRVAVASGVLASLCLVILYGWKAFLIGALPPALAGVHFVHLQRRAHTGV